jgi:GMP synthase (glutamine-hydrolysing)
MSKSSRSRRFLIVLCGNASAELIAEFGDFDARFCEGLGIAPDQAVVWSAHLQPEARPPLEGWAGVLVSGSRAMVDDGDPWMAVLAGWLRELLATETPLLAVCFGHQLLAAAHGVRVGPNGQGSEYGILPVQPAAGWAEDELFGGLSAPLWVHEEHMQAIARVPTGAVCLASSPRDPYHVLRYRPRAWSVQFHPESHPRMTRYAIESLASNSQYGHRRRLTACSESLPCLRDPQYRCCFQGRARRPCWPCARHGAEPSPTQGRVFPIIPSIRSGPAGTPDPTQDSP